MSADICFRFDYFQKLYRVVSRATLCVQLCFPGIRANRNRTAWTAFGSAERRASRTRTVPDSLYNTVRAAKSGAEAVSLAAVLRESQRAERRERRRDGRIAAPRGRRNAPALEVILISDDDEPAPSVRFTWSSLEAFVKERRTWPVCTWTMQARCSLKESAGTGAPSRKGSRT